MKKILLVDDEKEIRSLIRATLGDQQYEFYEATNGKEAVEKALSVVPDLVLLDILMPVMDGHEACRKIRSDPSTRSVTVIMLTAKGQDEDIEKGKESGADDYLIKPFSPLDLLRKVEGCLK